MKRFALKYTLALCALALLGSSAAEARNQAPPYDTSSTISYQGSTEGLPQVRFAVGDLDYLLALNADLYPTDEDLRAESRWVRRQSRDLQNFWNQYGDSVSASLSAYAGVPWQQDRITIHLVRYLSAWENPDPATLPIGGKRVSGIIEAAPTGAERLLSLIHIMAHQLIDNVSRLEYPQFNHPLMKRSPYHRENMAEILALSVAADILEHEKLLEVINSPEYARKHPGYDLLFGDIWNIWALSTVTPLTDLLSQEPFSGNVRYHADSALAAQNIKKEITQTLARRTLPLGGQFGMALEPVSAGLKVIEADSERLAFAYGIVEGDVIRSVNGLPAKKLREFYRELLATYETVGAELRIRRDKNEYTVQVKLAPVEPELEVDPGR